MFIEKIRVQNYKSIKDSGFIECDKLFTVLAGKNNVGKTALIEAIYRCFQGGLNSPSGSYGVDNNGIMQIIQNPVVIELLIKLDYEEIQNTFGDTVGNVTQQLIYAVFNAGDGQVKCMEFGNVLTDGACDYIFKWENVQINGQQQPYSFRTDPYNRSEVSLVDTNFFMKFKITFYNIILTSGMSTVDHRQINII